MTTYDTDATAATGTVRITVVQNSPDVRLDAYADLLAADLRVVRAFEGDAIPPADALGDGLVVLGGHMSAHDDVRATWLPALRETLLAAATTGVPTLGICLGAQLLAVAGGGHVQVSAPPGREAGATRVFWRADAETDPVLSALAGPVAGDAPVRYVTSMHADAIVDLPRGAVWLGSSNMYPYQAFRLGSALGVQFHPETTRAGFEAWCDAYDDVDTAAALAGFDEHAAEILDGGRRLAEAFVAEVRTTVGQSVPA
ncbi:GMP synthase (glutamine-hydrolyzing) [Cellulosimicrobium cellulans]|uniref:type 1 glutamine amidotransferase n=1 Tax=Cellulosimicrobium cellulans TaxID=1710 RepID=UPI0027DB2199|nr:type 1 glutamine amidotransferase [Cellulosimicrobium cellulans]MBM7821124.1 GMP synthase (glutamine-hydrolyzing) [Cellulosimicrobium cellulans]